MPYLSTFERNAIKKGMEQGIQQGMQQGMQQEVQRLLIQVLNIKFKKIPENLMEKIKGIIDKDTLETLHYQAVLCNSIEDFERELNNITS